MAARSLQLFLNQIAGAPTQFKLRLLQVVFDVLMVHESDFLSAGSGDNVSTGSPEPGARLALTGFQH